MNEALGLGMRVFLGASAPIHNDRIYVYNYIYIICRMHSYRSNYILCILCVYIIYSACFSVEVSHFGHRAPGELANAANFTKQWDLFCRDQVDGGHQILQNDEIRQECGFV